MKGLQEYTISIAKLSNKSHEYEYAIGSDFFTNFPESVVVNGDCEVNLEIDKSSTMLQLYFHIEGTIELICDRSLEPFDYTLDSDRDIILKFGNENSELTDEIEIIHRDTQEINVAKYIYEFITLEVPMKKIHPKFADESYEETNEGILIYRSQVIEDKEDSESDDNIDPRWEALKKIKK